MPVTATSYGVPGNQGGYSPFNFPVAPKKKVAYSSSNPAPQSGSGAFGKVPGVISTPDSTYDELNQNVPNYRALSAATTGNIQDELAGHLSHGTQNLLQDKAAAFGINSGLPGGTPGNTITNQNFLNSLGLTSEGLAHEGVLDYNQFSGTTGNQQLNPELAFGVSSQNAIDAAAPNPAAAASYSQSLYDKYLNQEEGPARTAQINAQNNNPNWASQGKSGNPMSVGLSWSPAADPSHVQYGSPGA